MSIHESRPRTRMPHSSDARECADSKELQPTPTQPIGRAKKDKVHPPPAILKPVRDSSLCKHPSRCNRIRSVKRNGELHWLCESHRHLQNAEQRERYHWKKYDLVVAKERSASSSSQTENVNGATASLRLPSTSSISHESTIPVPGERHGLRIKHRQDTKGKQQRRWKAQRFKSLRNAVVCPLH